MADLPRLVGELRQRRAREFNRKLITHDASRNRMPKEKTRPGGQPDGSSHMGAWGGWALAP